MMRTLRNCWFALLCALPVGTTGAAYGADEQVTTEAVQEATESVESEVQTETENQTIERRKQIMKEAVDALAKTNEALKALENEQIDDALEALAVITGKLELIVARDPDLALAPTDLTVTRHDIYATPEAIRVAVDEAEDALEDGRIQVARRILDGLGSELVISVANLPLATYPDAIKAITPLIDEGKIDEAIRGLQAALNTQVVTRHVVPLPMIRSEALLERAEELAEKADRSDAEEEELASLLSATRGQLEMAELLGYGNKEDFEVMFAQLDLIEEKTDEKKSGIGFFDNLKQTMAEMWTTAVS